MTVVPVRRLVAGLVVVTIGVGLGPAQWSAAQNSESAQNTESAQSSSSKQREVQRLQDELDELDDEMSLLNEQANEAAERLRTAEAELASATRSDAQRRYIEGPGRQLDFSGDFQTVSRRRMYVTVAIGRRADRIDALNEATEDLRRGQARAKRATASAKAERDALQKTLKRTEQLAARQERLLKGAKQDVIRLLAAEETRRSAAEAKAARAAEKRRQETARKLLLQRQSDRKRAEQRRADEAASAALRRRPRIADDAVPPTTRRPSRDRPEADPPEADPPEADRPEADRPETEAPDESDEALAAEAGQASGAPQGVGGSRAVEVAMSQLGKAYVWGANGPTAFDCSGLTSYAWARAGKRLPRTSRAQYAATRRVSRGELQPGDLLFFAKPGRPIHHVGMYIGNGQMVEAPHRRARVRVRDANRRDYVGAGRVL
jgi:peptidoglycan DL-endopeptidase CwlO